MSQRDDAAPRTVDTLAARTSLRALDRARSADQVVAPEGYEASVNDLDTRPGGRWRVTCGGPTAVSW